MKNRGGNVQGSMEIVNRLEEKNDCISQLFYRNDEVFYEKLSTKLDGNSEFENSHQVCFK